MKSVPLMKRNSEIGITFARVLVCGAAELKYKGQDISHDCIELHFGKCKCGKDRILTLEYGSFGVNLRKGTYLKSKEG